MLKSTYKEDRNILEVLIIAKEIMNNKNYN